MKHEQQMLNYLQRFQGFLQLLLGNLLQVGHLLHLLVDHVNLLLKVSDLVLVAFELYLKKDKRFAINICEE